jgi:hypothetical protein
MAKSPEIDEIKQLMADLPPADRVRVELLARGLREFLARGGEYAIIAFTLVGQEQADKFEAEEGPPGG